MMQTFHGSFSTLQKSHDALCTDPNILNALDKTDLKKVNTKGSGKTEMLYGENYEALLSSSFLVVVGRGLCLLILLWKARLSTYLGFVS